MLYLISFIFGSAIGSFVQVIVTRLGVSSIVNSRSKCLHCGKVLSWKELFPVLSYVLLRGRCKSCDSKYGTEHLIIEIIFGLIFVLIYKFILLGQIDLNHQLFWLVYYTLFFISLGVVALYDLKHKVMPMGYFILFFVLSILELLLQYQSNGNVAIFFSPLIVAFPFLLLFIVSRGKWLGFGDVLMLIAVGAFFPLLQGITVFFFSVWIGAIVGITLKIINKNVQMKTEIPFIPFIAVSVIIVLFLDIDIFSLIRGISI